MWTDGSITPIQAAKPTNSYQCDDKLSSLGITFLTV